MSLPFWKTFKKANGANLAKLPKHKPPCVDGQNHAWKIPTIDGNAYMVGRCKHCNIRWIFRAWSEEQSSWKKSGKTLEVNKESNMSKL